MADSLLELIAARERITFLENRLRAIEANARIAVDPAPSADRHTTPADECGNQLFRGDVLQGLCRLPRGHEGKHGNGGGLTWSDFPPGTAQFETRYPAPATPAGPEEKR